MARKPAQIHGVLCVDKPLGWTSRDVVNKVGHLLGERRCGHCGTLDPEASGLLLVAFGDASKLMRWFMQAHKTYETTIEFGSETLTDDAAGPVLRTAPVPTLDRQIIEAALPQPGEILQVPPAVSALQHEGVRDHERVRRGETLEREPRQVWLGDVEILEIEDNSATLRITCGAGFYIRSLARDLGRALQSAAHVRTLRRVAASGFGVQEGTTIEALLALDDVARRGLVLPLVNAGQRVLPLLPVDNEVVVALRQGKTPVVATAGLDWLGVGPAHCLVVDPDDQAVCVAELLADGTTRVERGMAYVQAAADD